MNASEGRQALSIIDALLADGAQAVQMPEMIRGEIKRRVEAAVEAQVDEALRTVPATDLREALPRGTRLGSLARSRYSTVFAIAAASPQAIAQTPGVGDGSAQAIFGAATQHRSRVASETRLRVNPDSRSADHTKLLQSVLAFSRVRETAEQLVGSLDRLSVAVEPLREDAGPGLGWAVVRWFRGRATMKKAEGAIARLVEIASSSDVVELRSKIDYVVQLSQDVPDPWREFERDAASVTSILSQFTETSTESETHATHGFIGTALAGEVERAVLDTALLKANLRRYQHFGAQYVLKQGKVILGDEMGLGKTVQALAVAAHLAAMGSRHALIVCPASVLINWVNETAKHTSLVPVVMHGPDRDVNARRWEADGGVGITTFGTLGKLSIRQAVQFVVVDEAHFIKNPDTQRSKVAAEAISRAAHAVLLTGTPMENRVSEFRHLVGYVQPDVARRINSGEGIGGATAFRRRVAPAYLRRNQDDVLTELPERVDVGDWVELSVDDADMYRNAVLSRNMMAMRQAAFAAGTGKSAKLDRLLAIVREAEDNGAKVLVFSYFRGVLDTIGQSAPGKVFGPLTGSTSSTMRQQIVDDFTNHRGPAVLVSQIEAGGVGLNVQAASVVVIAEPQWKPSTEEQAIARAHRMGQLRTVQVHRLLTRDSIDESIRKLLHSKTELFNSYARPSHAKDRDLESVAAGWVGDVREEDLIAIEQRRLGVA